jgi:hypothetical protein
MKYFEQKAATSGEKSELKDLNKAYTECLSRDFLGKFLGGENVKVDEFCQAEYKAMMTADRKIYQEAPFN